MNVDQVKDILTANGAYQAACAIFNEGTPPPSLDAVAKAMADAQVIDRLTGGFESLCRIVIDPVTSWEGLQQCLTKPLEVKGVGNLWGDSETNDVSPQVGAAARSNVPSDQRDEFAQREVGNMGQLGLNRSDGSQNGEPLGVRVTVLPHPFRTFTLGAPWEDLQGELAWARWRDDPTLPRPTNADFPRDSDGLARGIDEYKGFLHELVGEFGGRFTQEDLRRAHTALSDLLRAHQNPKDHLAIAQALRHGMPSYRLSESWRKGPFLAPGWRESVVRSSFYEAVVPYQPVDVRTAALLHRQSEVRRQREIEATMSQENRIGKWELDKQYGRVLVHPDQAGSGFLPLSRVSREGHTHVIGLNPNLDQVQVPGTLLPVTAIVGWTLVLDPEGNRSSLETLVRNLQDKTSWESEKK